VQEAFSHSLNGRMIRYSTLYCGSPLRSVKTPVIFVARTVTQQ